MNFLRKHMHGATLLLSFVLLGSVGCGESRSGGDWRKEYLPILEQLHALECEHLKMAGISKSYPDAYAFRAAAFQEVLKNLDRTVLVRYEDYYQKLADLEFRMEESAKVKYYTEVEHVYSRGCK